MPDITNSESQTHLSVIMFSDIVGYSKKMQENEDLTMKLLARHNQIVRDALSKHEGKEIKMIGDAFLVSFTTVANAVRCAVDIQESFAKYNETAAEKEKILLRIGIHMGDIIVKDDDVFGDGVNIASRIELLAEPGGICISQEVYNLVRHKLDLQAVSLGPKELKNIKEKIEIYEILVGSIATSAHKSKRRRKKRKNWIYALAGLFVIFIGIMIVIKSFNKPSTPMLTWILKTGSNRVYTPNISPDGNWIVYVTYDSKTNPNLYVIPSSGGEPRKITRDTNLVYYDRPCFSSDASQIVYSISSNNNVSEIDIIPTLGGKSRKLVSNGDDPVWSPDGKHIAFFRRLLSVNEKGLFIIKPDGMGETKITSIEPVVFYNIAWSPDSKRLAFLRSFLTATDGNYAEIFSRALDDSAEHQMTFDKKIIRDFCWTSTGEIIFNSNRSGSVCLWVIPEKGGTPKQLTLGTGTDMFPCISKDAKRLIYLNEPVTSNLWTIDLQTKEPKQLTFEEGFILSVAYSPDGSQLIYSREKPFERAQDEFVICNNDGSEPTSLRPTINDYSLDPFLCMRWSADMKSFFFSGFRNDTARKNPDSIVVRFSFFEHELATNVNRKIGDGTLIDISRDGKYILYAPGNNQQLVLALKSTPDNIIKIIEKIAIDGTMPYFSWDSKNVIVQDSIGVWFIPCDLGKRINFIKPPKFFHFVEPMPNDKLLIGTIRTPVMETATLVKLYSASGRIEEITKLPPRSLLVGASFYNYCSVSPDGKTLVFGIIEGKDRIMVLDNFR